jgi:hypothetical protein
MMCKNIVRKKNSSLRMFSKAQALAQNAQDGNTQKQKVKRLA